MKQKELYEPPVVECIVLSTNRPVLLDNSGQASAEDATTVEGYW